MKGHWSSNKYKKQRLIIEIRKLKLELNVSINVQKYIFEVILIYP
jgi:hypothetical protein